MSEPIRLVLVTDNPEKAAPAIFGMVLDHLPAWVLVMSDWRQIEALEEGAPCLAVWFPRGAQPSLAELTWRERRQTVRLDDDFGHHFDRVTSWLERRSAAERELLARADTEDRDREGVATFAELTGAQAAHRAVETTVVKKFPQPSKWS